MSLRTCMMYVDVLTPSPCTMYGDTPGFDPYSLADCRATVQRVALLVHPGRDFVPRPRYGRHPHLLLLPWGLWLLLRGMVR